MYGCESWTIKKAECQRTGAFELWCWRRCFRVPCTAKTSNQSILKEISLEYSLEQLILKLKLQCFGHLMRRADSWEKTLMLGKIEGRRRRGWQRARWFDGITDSMDMSLSKFREMVKDRKSWHAAVHNITESDTTEQLNNNSNKGENFGFPSGSVVETPLAKQEVQVQSLGQEDILEKETATYSSILACDTPWTGEPGRLSPWGHKRVGHQFYELPSKHFSFSWNP